MKRYETTDIKVSAIAWFALGLLIVAILVHLVLGWQLQALKRAEPDPKQTQIGATDQKIPRAPRLEISELARFPEYRAQKTAILDSYGWIDRKKGIARIPIERAMELYATQ